MFLRCFETVQKLQKDTLDKMEGETKEVAESLVGLPQLAPVDILCIFQVGRHIIVYKDPQILQ